MIKKLSILISTFFLLVNVSVSAQVLVSTFAGNGINGSSNDGLGTNAGIIGPQGLAVDASGNIYVATFDSKIKKITPAGQVITIAGTGANGSNDGPGSTATFFLPKAVAVDLSGNVYVADYGNHKIRKITPLGIVSTFAGNGNKGNSDGTGVSASFRYPMGITTDASGNVYVSDTYNHLIRKITPSGVVSTIAGIFIYSTQDYGLGGFVDGTISTALFNFPAGISIDPLGNFFIADGNNNRIRKITSTGIVSTIAGTGISGSDDGVSNLATFNHPNGVALDAAGNIFVSDNNNKIRKVTPLGEVTTYAGSGLQGAVDGLGQLASFNSPWALGIDASSNLFVADLGNSKVRKISPLTNVTWNGSSWFPTTPDIIIPAIINGNYSTATNGNFTSKDLTIYAGQTLTIASGTTVTVGNTFVNNGTLVNCGTLSVSGVISSGISTSAISGPTSLCGIANNITYQVTNTIGSTYAWTIPAGATIVGPTNKNKIVVNFSSFSSGSISVIETNASGCVGLPVSLNLALGSNNYALGSVNTTCSQSTLKVPLTISNNVAQNLIGYTYEIRFDASKLSLPATNRLSLGTVATTGNLNATYTANVVSPGVLKGAIYINGGLPTQQFSGSGLIAEVNFTKDVSLVEGTTALVTVYELKENYRNGTTALVCVVGSTVSGIADRKLTGTIKLRNTATNLGYDAAVPNKYLVTNITATNNACIKQGTAVQPNLSGVFTIELTGATGINLNRDINPATTVSTYIQGVNGADALKIDELINGVATTATLYELLAADVDGNGELNLADRNLILLRATGTDYPSGRDWTFIDRNSVTADDAYKISTVFPNNDGFGYSLTSIPQVPTCLPYRTVTTGTCVSIPASTYEGILMGDVNGNFNNNINSALRTESIGEVIANLDKATVSGNVITVPLYINTTEPIKSFDLVADYNQANLEVLGFDAAHSSITLVGNDYKKDTILISSFSSTEIASGKVWAYVKFKTNTGSIKASDLNQITTLLNDQSAEFKVESKLEITSLSSLKETVSITIAPNPSNGTFVIHNGEEKSITYQLTDPLGKVYQSGLLQSGNNELQTTLPVGLYLLHTGSQVTKIAIR